MKALPFILFGILAFLFLSDCTNVQSRKNTFNLADERFVLVQVVDEYPDVHADVYGDPLRKDGYYSLTKTNVLIPVGYFYIIDPLSRMSVEQKLDGLNAMGNLVKEDTDITLSAGGRKLKVTLFHLPSLNMPPGSFN